MPAPLLWAFGFAIGVVAWLAVLWLLLVSARATIAGAATTYRELQARHRAAEQDRAVTELDAVRLAREERIERRAAARRRVAA